jgi:hypothetical protein
MRNFMRSFFSGPYDDAEARALRREIASIRRAIEAQQAQIEALKQAVLLLAEKTVDKDALHDALGRRSQATL